MRTTVTMVLWVALAVASVEAGEPGVVLSPGKTWVSSLGMELLSVPPRPGTTDGPLWLGRTEVTQEVYELIIGANPSRVKGPDLPVTGVTLGEAEAFCRLLTRAESRSGHLPTGWAYGLPPEERWEQACRAGQAETEGEDLEAAAWFCESCLATPAATGPDVGPRPVATRKANAWGFHDMMGNVWEWCVGGDVDEGAVVRGGAYASGPRDCRPSSRYLRDPEYRGPTQGFRLALVGSAAPLQSPAGLPSPAPCPSPPSAPLSLPPSTSTTAPGSSLTGALGIRYAWVPPGAMSIRPVWRLLPPGAVVESTNVTFAHGFWLGVTEVTQGQWEALMSSRPAHFPGEDRPVESVSWKDATEFCRLLSEREGVRCRLPTEAEWEYAARGAGVPPGSPASMDPGWCRDSAGGSHHGVGTRQAGPLGIFDMVGNVKEFCGDLIGAMPGFIRLDGGSDERALRGGSYASPRADCHPEGRDLVPAGRKHASWGFRVLREQAPAKVN